MTTATMSPAIAMPVLVDQVLDPADPSVARDPREVDLLVRAHELFRPRMQALYDSGKMGASELAELTDDEAMAAAFAIIGAEWMATRRHDPTKPIRCGWCIVAAGDTDEAALICALYRNSAEVRKHTEVCAHNPLVTQRADLRADLERARERLAAMTTARNEACGMLARTIDELAEHEEDPGMMDAHRALLENWLKVGEEVPGG